MWNHHTNNEIHQVGFKQLAVDECVWYKGETIFFYYMDDGIFMVPDSNAVDREIEQIEISGLDIKEKGNI